MPGMLEYLLLDEGRRAGLTSSPDFFLTRGGLRNPPSSSSLSSDPEVAFADSVKLGLETTIAVSVDDLECEIFLASAVNMFGEVTWVVGSEELKTVTLAGDESRCRLIDLTACCKSFHVDSASLFLGLRSFCSSPSEFSEESGGEMIAPVGMTRLLTGGGD